MITGDSEQLEESTAPRRTRRRLGHRAAALSLIALGMLASGLGACQRPDPEIAAEYRSIFWAEPPAIDRRNCPDRPKRLARLGDVLALVRDALAQVKRYADPLPAALQERLLATDLLGRAADYRCLMSAYEDREPAEPRYFVALGGLTNLYFRKAELLLKRGELGPGYDHVLEALVLYEQPLSQAFIWYLPLQTFLDRIPGFLAAHRPGAAVLGRLQAALAKTVLTRETFCAGMREEVLQHGASLFLHHLKELLPRFADRWGKELAALFESPQFSSPRLDRAAWTVFRATFAPVLAACRSRPFRDLDLEAQGGRALLAEINVAVAQLCGVVLQRLQHFATLQDVTLAVAVDVARLRHRQMGREPRDIMTLYGDLPVPLASPWDRSPASLVREGDRWVVRRGAFRREL